MSERLPDPDTPPGWVPPRLRPVPPMDHAAGGKASAYTPEMGELILARIAAGETVKAITADPRMPAYCTVYQWVRVHDDFAEAWVAVRQAQAQRRVATIAQRDAARRFWPAHKARVDGRRWWRRGRPSSYTRAKGVAVCELIEAGWPLSAVVRRADMPSSKVVYTWLRTQAEFRGLYAQACQFREWLLCEQMSDAAGAATAASFADARQEVAWLRGQVGRMTPRTYRVAPRPE